MEDGSVKRAKTAGERSAAHLVSVQSVSKVAAAARLRDNKDGWKER